MVETRPFSRKERGLLVFMKRKLFIKGIFLLLVSLLLIGCFPKEKSVTENQAYSSKDEVTLYIKTYKKLPNNYITKQEAMALGWDSSKGNLWEVTDKKSIGGDVFGNFERKLPNQKGRIYYEADIDYKGGFRNAKRMVFSNDGLIFYTKDHYKSFERLD